MSENDVSRILERLEGIVQRLATIEANQQSAKEVASDTSSKLDVLRTGGCTMGRDHDRRLGQLEARPERMIAIGALIVAVGGWILEWLNSK